PCRPDSSARARRPRGPYPRPPRAGARFEIPRAGASARARDRYAPRRRRSTPRARRETSERPKLERRPPREPLPAREADRRSRTCSSKFETARRAGGFPVGTDAKTAKLGGTFPERDQRLPEGSGSGTWRSCRGRPGARVPDDGIRRTPQSRSVLEPARRIVAGADVVFVHELREQLTDRPVEGGVLQLGRQVRQRPDDELALGEEQVRDLKIVARAHDLVAIEQDVDVEGPRSEELGFGCSRRPDPAHVGLAALD